MLFYSNTRYNLLRCIRTLLLVLLFGLLLRPAVLAQTAFTDTLPVNTADQFILKEHLWYYEDTTRKEDLTSVAKLKQQGKFQLLNKVVLNRGYTKSHYWVTFTIKNVCDTAVSLYFWEASSAVNRMVFYQYLNNKLITMGPTGDHYPFKQRPVRQHRSFLFPIHLTPGQATTCYLLIDQHDQNLYAPMYLCKDTAILHTEVESNAIYGFYGGIYLFAIMFNLFLWLSLKDRIHIYYLLYTACTLIFALEEEGLGFKWIYPGIPYLHDYLRSLMGLVGSALIIVIMQQFLIQTAKDGLVYRVANAVKWLCWIFTIILVPFLLLVKTSWSGRFMLYSCLILCVLSIVIAFYSGVVKIFQRYRPAILYTAAIFTFLIGVLNYAFNTLGITNFNLMKPNGVVVGSTIEVILLAFALTQRYNFLKKAHAKALESENELRQQTTQKVVQAQEDERARIARDLHDDLGGTLSAVKLHIASLQSSVESNAQQETYNYAAFLIKKACEDLRHISYDLMPADFANKGLLGAIEHHVNQVNLYDTTQFQFAATGSDALLKPTFSISVYRIVTELINNIVKHANAKQACIELSIFGDTLKLIARDNGTGFNQQEPYTGIGLNNIRSRVQFLGGEVQINSSQAGTVVEIQLSV